MNRRPLYFRLDPEVGNGRVPIPCESIEEQVLAAPHDRRVAYDDLGPVYVSTVFLGIDHAFWAFDESFEEIPPLLFETMVFASEGEWSEMFQMHFHEDHDQRRYSTWEDAELGHRETVEEWKQRIVVGGDEDAGRRREV